MNRSKHIHDELEEIAPTLAAVSPQMPYSVPAGYFNNLPRAIIDRVQEFEAAPGLLDLNKKDPYSVPSGYFDGLAGNIMARIKGEAAGDDARAEISSLSPLLAGISRNMPYAVPSGYFEQLAMPTVAAQPAKAARVISIKASRVLRYAVAAVIAGVIGVTAWLFVSQPSAKIDKVSASTEPVSEQQLLSRINKLSDSEIANFVEAGTPVFPLDNGATGSDLADLDAALMFEEVSDEELERYIQSNQPGKEKFN